MPMVIIQTYNDFSLTGHDFPDLNQSDLPERAQDFSTFLGTPNNNNVIRFTMLYDGKIVMKNPADIDYNFSVSNGARNLAFITYERAYNRLVINENWKLSRNIVSNRMIDNHPIIPRSSFFNIDIHATRNRKFNTMSLRVDNGSFATLFFTDCELLFVRFNGIYARNRFLCHMNGVENLNQIPAIVENTDENQLDPATNENPPIIRAATGENQMVPVRIETPVISRQSFLRFLMEAQLEMEGAIGTTVATYSTRYDLLFRFLIFMNEFISLRTTIQIHENRQFQSRLFHFLMNNN